MTELIKKLSDVCAPTGREGAMRDFLTRQLSGKCELCDDAAGNLVAHFPGDGAKMMITAPMDETSFLVKSSENGFSKFETIGKGSAAIWYGGMLRTEGGVGVVSVCPIHLSNGDKSSYPTTSAMSIEMPCNATAGTFGTLEPNAETFGDGGYLLRGKASAQRALIAAMLGLAGCEKKYDLWLVFAGCGAISGGGARCAAERIKPEYAVILSITGDTSGFSADKSASLAVPLIDSGAVHDNFLTGDLTRAAELHGVKTFIPKARLTSPASIIAGLCGGIKTAMLALPAALIGSSSEYFRIKDASALAEVLTEVIKP